MTKSLARLGIMVFNTLSVPSGIVEYSGLKARSGWFFNWTHDRFVLSVNR